MATNARRCARLGAFALTVVLNVMCSPPTDRTLPACVGATPAQAAGVVTKVVAVGDVADCSGGRQDAVAALMDRLRPDAVMALGDLAYPNGSVDDFLDCYAPSFGRFRAITHPVVGNHEYHTPHAGAYYAYFCGASGNAFEGWYSFDLGAWHVVALNSNCGGDLDVAPDVAAEFGGCGGDSPQVAWLRADLAHHPRKCTIAMWHHPRWSSSSEGSTPAVSAFWGVLAELGVDIVLNGHAHDYQRFPRLDAAGNPSANGPRTFIVGTGGSSLSSFDDDSRVRSEVRDNTSHGVLELDLGDGSYEWHFEPIDGDGFRDEGRDRCHL